MLSTAICSYKPASECSTLAISIYMSTQRNTLCMRLVIYAHNNNKEVFFGSLEKKVARYTATAAPQHRLGLVGLLYEDGGLV